MQGNSDFNKEFIDQSWSQMEALLQQQLPVTETESAQRSGRSVLIWLLSALLLMTTSTAILFAYKYQTVPKITEIVKEKIIYKEILKEVFVPQSMKKDPAPESNSSGDEALHRTLSEDLNSNLSKDAVTTALVQNASSVIDPGKFFNDFPVDLSAGMPVEIEALSHSLEIPEMLLDLDLNPNENEETQKRGIKFNLGVIMSSSRDFDFTGMGIASGVQLPITKRLDLNTGLAVSYMDKAHFFVPAFHRNPSSKSPKSLAEYYFNGLKNIKQVSLPVSLDYSITKSLALNSGVNLRYTYVEKVDNNLELPNNPRIAASPTENDHESLFNNANFGLSAGVKYRFSPHVSILLNSEWGMSSIINKNQFQHPSQVQYDLNVINLRTNFTF